MRALTGHFGVKVIRLCRRSHHRHRFSAPRLAQDVPIPSSEAGRCAAVHRKSVRSLPTCHWEERFPALFSLPNISLRLFRQYLSFSLSAAFIWWVLTAVSGRPSRFINMRLLLPWKLFPSLFDLDDRKQRVRMPLSLGVKQMKCAIFGYSEEYEIIYYLLERSHHYLLVHARFNSCNWHLCLTRIVLH